MMQKFTLKWHYRSKEESLIAFSNYHFYGNELVSFPNPVKDASKGVHFHHVPNGVYNRGASRKDNIPEAEEVAKLTLQHFQDNRHMSLGIITSNSYQAAAIRKQLNDLRVEHPDFEEFCQENTEKFFIKPLEQVQGDERDVILLSFVYGRDSEGKLTQGFGPFNKKIQEIGRRRLNVAITRAKYKLVLVASIQAGDLQADNNPEVKLIQDFFIYAASGDPKLQSGFDISPNSDLALEEDIYLALTQRGYSVQRRVGCSAYRIDLAVRDNQQPEEFLLGIECDGRKYSRLPTARDRDRLRQEVLKKLGWRIYRIWSREWNRDRDNQINRLVQHIENLRNQK
jgi:very-short-patch-repair endonuclease